jgi:hypothetical protein
VTGFSVPASALQCGVRGPAGPVAVKRADDVTLTTGGDRYVSRYTFEANADGFYVVRCRSTLETPSRVPLAVGPHLGILQIVATVFGVIGAFGGGLLLAGGVAGLVAILRHRSKVRRQREGAGPGAAPPGPA